MADATCIEALLIQQLDECKKALAQFPKGGTIVLCREPTQLLLIDERPQTPLWSWRPVQALVPANEIARRIMGPTA